uniref:Uncharacterized protein n=1 Tax=Arundo donax TaxID=35708 RepID=A0A0A8ZYE7_ARUDO
MSPFDSTRYETAGPCEGHVSGSATPIFST